MRKLFFFSSLLLSLNSIAGPKVPLDWTMEYRPSGKDSDCMSWNKTNYSCNIDKGSYASFSEKGRDRGVIKFLSAQIERNKLIFEVLAHNDGSTDQYQCLIVGSSDDATHVDDDLAEEFKGLKVELKNGQDNKLALNQRKKFKLILPAPSKQASVANIHLGFYFGNVPSTDKCWNTVQNWKLNFHKIDWDITPLRAQPAQVSSN